MARVYISSTFQDLSEAREAVYKAVRRLGHQSVAMESWAVSDSPMLERSLDEVRSSDILIGLVGWRYGYIPPGQDQSITELEINAALEAGIPCLLFLLSEDAPIRPKFVDRDPGPIERFRSKLSERSVVNVFRDVSELEMRVSIALLNWVAHGREQAPIAPERAEVKASPPGPEVFVSYAHEDVAVAEAIAARLGNENWSVFWDRTIPVGLTWDDIVEQALDSAKCVVVLWSAASRDSDWVRIEANEGAERGILAPALIQNVKIPLRFRRIQAANLIGWVPRSADTLGIEALVSAVRRCLAAPVRDAV